METVVITGGAGFAGHHLVEHLLQNTDWTILILDSLTYAGRTDRLLDIDGFDYTRVTIRWHDLRAEIPTNITDGLPPIKYILHLAAESHVERSITDPVPFVHNNVMATLNMLEWARKIDTLEHFIQISTDEVYGPAPEGKAHQEWIDPMLPSNPYAASKVSQEAIAISYWRTYGVPLTITNTMNLFGERQHPEKFLPKTIRDIAQDKPALLHARPYTDPDTGLIMWEPSERHWLHARNHADALLWILWNISPVNYAEVSKTYHGTIYPNRFHVAGEKKNVLEIASAVAHAIGKSTAPEIQWVDYHSSRPGHDHRYALDSSKIHEAGWTEKFSFAESIEKTVQWMVKNDRWLNDY